MLIPAHQLLLDLVGLPGDGGEELADGERVGGVGQFVWAVYDDWPRLGVPGLFAALGGVGLFLLLFQGLGSLGRKFDRRRLAAAKAFSAT